MHRTLGTCSRCGGAVTVPEAWMGINPPVPTCQSCGATKKQPHGPVIDMEPAAPRPTRSDEWREAIALWRQRRSGLPAEYVPPNCRPITTYIDLRDWMVAR